MFEVPFFLLVSHFVGDFLLQSNWMGTHKNKDWGALTLHVAIYTWTLLLFMSMFAPEYWTLSTVLTFAFANGVAHWWTDALTSRITSKLWFINVFDLGDVPLEKEPALELWKGGYHHYNHAFYYPTLRFWFFAMIGLDQLLHYAMFAYLWSLLS